MTARRPARAGGARVRGCRITASAVATAPRRAWPPAAPAPWPDSPRRPDVRLPHQTSVSSASPEKPAPARGQPLGPIAAQPACPDCGRRPRRRPQPWEPSGERWQRLCPFVRPRHARHRRTASRPRCFAARRSRSLAACTCALQHVTSHCADTAARPPARRTRCRSQPSAARGAPCLAGGSAAARAPRQCGADPCPDGTYRLPYQNICAILKP